MKKNSNIHSPAKPAPMRKSGSAKVGYSKRDIIRSPASSPKRKA